MSAEIETQAIVLRRFEYGETSQIAHLITPVDGRISCLAKGIRKPNPNLKGPFDLFQLATCRYRRRSASELALMVRFEPLTGFVALRESLDRIYGAFYLSELVWETTRDGARDPEGFTLLARALDALCAASPAATPSIVAATELSVLERTGFLPSLRACARCGVDPAPADASFLPQGGGLACPRCTRIGERTAPLRPGTRALLQALLGAEPSGADRVRMSDGQVREVRTVLRAILEAVLERPLRSEPFVSDPRHGFLRVSRRPARVEADPRHR